MNTIVTYLTSLQSKVFKLLPMREAYDNGDDNHLYEYLDNLQSNCNGAFICYPELCETSMLVEVQNNLAFLRNSENVAFKKWRATVLRSTRLIHSALDRFREGKYGC